jgi:uncharacterized membrane protein
LVVLNYATVTIIISYTVQVKDENHIMLKGRCTVVRYAFTLALLYVLVIGFLDRKLAKSRIGWYMAIMTRICDVFNVYCAFLTRMRGEARSNQRSLPFYNYTYVKPIVQTSMGVENFCDV